MVLGIPDLTVLVNNICNFNAPVLFRYCTSVIKWTIWCNNRRISINKCSDQVHNDTEMKNVKGKPPSFLSTLLGFFKILFFSDCTIKQMPKNNPSKHWSFFFYKLYQFILKYIYKLSMKPWLVFRVASHAVCVWNINQSFTPISSHQNPYTPANSQLILTTLSNNVESYQKYVMARWLLLQVKLRCRDFRLFRGFLRLWFWLFLCLLLFLFAFLFLLLLAILFLFFHVLYFLRLLFFFSFLKGIRNKYMNHVPLLNCITF